MSFLTALLFFFFWKAFFFKLKSSFFFFYQSLKFILHCISSTRILVIIHQVCEKSRREANCDHYISSPVYHLPVSHGLLFCTLEGVYYGKGRGVVSWSQCPFTVLTFHLHAFADQSKRQKLNPCLPQISQEQSAEESQSNRV